MKICQVTETTRFIMDSLRDDTLILSRLSGFVFMDYLSKARLARNVIGIGISVYSTYPVASF